MTTVWAKAKFEAEDARHSYQQIGGNTRKEKGLGERQTCGVTNMKLRAGTVSQAQGTWSKWAER